MPNRTDQLRDQARKCRDLAESAVTAEARAILAEIAERYDRESTLAEAEEKIPSMAG